jgi:hypothetical protein
MGLRVKGTITCQFRDEKGACETSSEIDCDVVYYDNQMSLNPVIPGGWFLWNRFDHAINEYDYYCPAHSKAARGIK